MLSGPIAMMIAVPGQDCANAIAQTEMTQCAASEYRRADAAMNAQWQLTTAVMKRRDAKAESRGGGFGYVAALLESQRAWLKFRDTHCLLVGGEYAGGTMQPMVKTRCQTRLTDQRTEQLKLLIRGL